jgi:hypothetical protein
MTDTQTEEQGRKPKVCKLATASAVLILVVLCTLLMGVLVVHSEPSSETFAKLLFFSAMACAPIGLIVGIFAVVRIKRSKGGLTGYRHAALGVGVAAFLIFLVSFCSWAARQKYGPSSKLWVVLCRNNLHQLGVAMQLHANENEGTYPACEKWCDLLLQGQTARDKRSFAELFVCRGAKRAGDQERCHYAMNPNCEPNSPNDVVLLVETKGGWNQYGGPEILTTENHAGKGCTVLFNDGTIEFVETRRIRMLRWSDGPPK